MDQTFAADGFEIRPAVLRSQEIAYIQAEVSVDHEILRRTGIRNLKKKFRSIARVAADSSVLSIAATHCWVRLLSSSGHSSSTRPESGTGLWPGTKIEP